MMNDTSSQKTCGNIPDKGDYIPGRYVERLHGFEASVLAKLLEGKELTDRDVGYRTMLQGAICALRTDYGWQIDARQWEIGVHERRPVRFTTYSLNPELIARAYENDADFWQLLVKLAHAVLAIAKRHQSDMTYSEGMTFLTTVCENRLRRRG